MKALEFVKMHGLGNDFVLIDGAARVLSGVNLPRVARAISNRCTGVGSDGLIVILPARKAACRMRIFNSDGSEAEMSGNGLRCLVRYLYDLGRLRKKTVIVETGAGPIACEVRNSSQSAFTVQVELGRPEFKASRIPAATSRPELVEAEVRLGGKTIKLTAVSVGNPHAVIFVDSFEFEWMDLGKRLENHALFPERANVEFVQVHNRGTIAVRSWERGAGPTMASGTGASAAVAAGIRTGRLEREVEVRFALGSLRVRWDQQSGKILLAGPAEYVFSGTYEVRKKRP